MTESEIKAILSNVACFDRKFVLLAVDGDPYVGFAIHVEYTEDDIDTGKPELQRSREWMLPDDATETDIVNTAFACVMRSYDHVVQEHFMYKGRRVFSPHFDIDLRLQMAKAQALRNGAGG